MSRHDVEVQVSRMQIELRTSRLSHTPALQSYVERTLDFALNRLQNHVRRVSVHLVDENGPRGGVDKSCIMHAYLRRPAKEVVVRERDASIPSALDRAAERIKNACTRALQRVRPVRGPRVRQLP